MGSFVKDVHQNFPLVSPGNLHPQQDFLLSNEHPEQNFSLTFYFLIFHSTSLTKHFPRKKTRRKLNLKVGKLELKIGRT